MLDSIDARGLSCPQPVILAQKGLKSNPDGIVIIVDNATAKNNVERFIRNEGFKVSIREDNDEFILTAEK
ncbi:MAG: sulfurtransferase TusA family protein [Clostridiaceae bacterium]